MLKALFTCGLQQWKCRNWLMLISGNDPRSYVPQSVLENKWHLFLVTFTPWYPVNAGQCWAASRKQFGCITTFVLSRTANGSWETVHCSILRRNHVALQLGWPVPLLPFCIWYNFFIGYSWQTQQNYASLKESDSYFSFSITVLDLLLLAPKLCPKTKAFTLKVILCSSMLCTLKQNKTKHVATDVCLCVCVCVDSWNIVWEMKISPPELLIGTKMST